MITSRPYTAHTSVAIAAALCAATMLVAFPAIGQQLSYDQALSPGAIRSVQERLRQMGAYSGSVDGVWGNDSQAALQQFQQGHGLQVTGQLNQATAALLNLNPSELLLAGQPDVTAVPGPARPLSRAEVRNVQSRMRALGFYRGDLDGVWGPGMQEALQRFQQSSGIQVSGRLNTQTVTALGLNPGDLAQPVR